jgi:hypothetical protein
VDNPPGMSGNTHVTQGSSLRHGFGAVRAPHRPDTTHWRITSPRPPLRLPSCFTSSLLLHCTTSQCSKSDPRPSFSRPPPPTLAHTAPPKDRPGIRTLVLVSAVSSHVHCRPLLRSALRPLSRFHARRAATPAIQPILTHGCVVVVTRLFCVNRVLSVLLGLAGIFFLRRLP